MKNFVFIIFTISAFYTGGFPQSNQNVAPIKWEKYKISDKKLTVMFPKLPVKLDFANRCSQIVAATYYAYAEEVVYEFQVFQKTNQNLPNYCEKPEKFTDKSYSSYLNKAQLGFTNTQIIERGSNKYTKFDKDTNTNRVSKWLFNDEKNSRWFEFTISSRTDKNINENQFIDSLKFEADSSAIEINDGSATVLGDSSANNEKQKEQSIEDKEARQIPLNIVFKAKPKYTDKARETNTIGTVKLRVTFLQNGSIGNIDVVDKLSYGLTEQAIIAARKMAFQPQRNGDQKLSVTKVVVFNFSIY